jgi:hypothetical protein
MGTGASADWSAVSLGSLLSQVSNARPGAPIFVLLKFPGSVYQGRRLPRWK